MQKTAFTLVGAFLLTLAAGGVLGRLMAPAPVSTANPYGGWLARELQLTPEQSRGVQQIWDSAHQRMVAQNQQREDARKRMQDGVYAILDSQQRAQYDSLQQKYLADVQVMDADADGVVTDSIRRTNELLTAGQREMYTRLLDSFPAWGPAESASQPTPLNNRMQEENHP